MVRSPLALLPVAAVCIAWPAAPKTLDVQLIDVEGGKAVLVVTPAGESMLFDAGWDATRGASTDRLVDALKAAGLRQIDYLVISHYDIDHLGDVPKLAERVPVRHLVDHGPYEFGMASTRQRYSAYAELFRTIPHVVVKPGDRIPLKGIEVDVVSAAGNLITTPVKGAGAPNPFCATNPRQDEITNNKEDNSSVGLLFTYGKFRMLDLADLEAYKDHDLVCPANLLGTVDVYQVNVHGQRKGMAPELVEAVHPRVAMMGNGSRKGADLATWPVLRETPGLEDIWQVHYSTNGSKDTNPPDDFIANLEPSMPPNDQWKTLKLSASPDGGFTITNERNGFQKKYPPAGKR